MNKKIRKSILVFIIYLLNQPTIVAQELEPRAYSSAPTGLNFAVIGFQHSEGGLLFDPALPVTDASSRTNVSVTGYLRTLDVAGMSAKAGIVLPYATLYAQGLVDGEFRIRDTKGLADPALYFSLNFYGAPALNLKEFRTYKQDTIAGFTIKVTPPLGHYDKDKLINIGTNRWSIKPELGVSKAINRWILEGSLATTFYTKNNEFDTSKTRHQEPVYSMQGHLTYTFKNKIWLSYGVTYFTGGETRVDGVVSNDLQNNSRTGFTAAIPVNKYNSIKILMSAGLSTRTGTDYDSIGVFWQYRWGASL
ncbi:MAG: transporter [endosymbiont of Galathealinum brachiosum]|uniref:Transporter n=1 Tax=endosymbiont of Galathealinum brachiosum TaxID=2200906 RepID=A0A370DME7_9GAMM|nr:MAG: transporter [endosymbiont of Galathealinum brachiosum]